VVVTAGERGGSTRQALSANTGGLGILRRCNRAGIGSASVTVHRYRYILKGDYYNPTIKNNLISVAKLENVSYESGFAQHKSSIQGATG